MKMKRFYLLAAVACLAAAVGCDRIEQNGVPETGKTIRLHIEAQAPEISKTTLSDDLQLVWEGTEKLGIIFGNESSSNAATSAVVELPSTAPGVFEGEVAIPSGFTANDIKGVAYPAEGAFFKYQSGQNRIVTTVPTAQTQASEGKLNGKNTPVFAVWDASKWEVADGTYSPVNLSLDWACSIIRFNIYGELEGIQADEKVQSLVFVGDNTNLCGTAEYNTAGSNKGKFTYNGKGATMTLNLEEPALLSGRTQTSPLVLYMGVLGRGTGTNSSKVATITSFSIITDRATYNYSPEGKTISPAPGEGYPLGLNLAKFTREVKINYSVDGGTTWTNELPATFTTLAVKSSAALGAVDLQQLAAAVKAQSGNVDLDLSQTTVDRTDVNGTLVGLFPAVFGNETAEDAVRNLHSIVFPSNVTAVAANAFYNCAALESLDLAKITSIEENAFRATGLVDLTVPATVTNIGKYAFGYCWKLETLYFDSAAHQGKGSSNTTHTFSCRNTEAVETLPDEYKAANLIPLTATFGPHAVIGNNDFDTNHKLVKMIFEGKPTVNGNSWVVRCRYLNEFDFSKVSDPVAAGANNTGAIGELTPENSRKIYVPAGCGEAYYAANTWKALVDNNHFVIVESTDSDIKYSTDGGTTWADAIPSGSFTTLAVKGEIFASTLADIKTAIDAQEGVALDLSEAVYESVTFPNTFAGSSSSSPYMKLKSIKFPSNVVTLAASAFSYCKGLESADLTGIQNLSPEANNYFYAFADTGLKSITFPATFTGAMERSFVNTYDLETIYWNTPWNPGTSQNWRTFQWGRGNNSATDNTPKSKDLVLYIGANAVAVPMNGFRNNHNLSKVVVEAGAGFTFLNNCFVNCDNLAVFELKGAEPPAIRNVNMYDAATTSSKVEQASRKVIIPHGATATYTAHANWANWATLISTLNFTLEEAAE